MRILQFTKLLFLLFALASASSFAGSVKPLDFSYTASGSKGVRPSLIFNDGKDTFIQLSPKQVMSSGLVKVGSYYMLRGTPSVFNLVINNTPINVTKLSKPKVKVDNEMSVESKFGLPIGDAKKQLKPFKKDLVLKRGQRLSHELTDFASAYDIDVKWQSNSDFLVKKHQRITGDNPQKMIVAYLKSLGFESGFNGKTIFVMDQLEVENHE